MTITRERLEATHQRFKSNIPLEAGDKAVITEALQTLIDVKTAPTGDKAVALEDTPKHPYKCLGFGDRCDGEQAILNWVCREYETIHATLQENTAPEDSDLVKALKRKDRVIAQAVSTSLKNSQGAIVDTIWLNDKDAIHPTLYEHLICELNAEFTDDLDKDIATLEVLASHKTNRKEDASELV